MKRIVALMAVIASLTVNAQIIDLNRPGLDLIFIGNSITYGGTLTNPETDAPPAVVKELLTKRQELGHVEVANLAVCGTTSVDWMPATNTFFNEIIKKGDEFYHDSTPLIFCLSLGTNDSAEKGTNGAPVSRETFAQNLYSIIDSLNNRYPQAFILVNHPIWYSQNTYNTAEYLVAGQQRLSEYCDVINDVVNNKFRAKDRTQVYLGDTEGWNVFCENTRLFTPEEGKAGIFYLHPNKDGARVLAALWEKHIYNLWRLVTPTEIKLTSGATLLLYKAQGEPSDKAIVVCPGGGYEYLAQWHEGRQMAHWLSNNGVTAGVLLYRMPNGNKDIPLKDAQEAIEYMRNNAKDLGNYTQVGIMGSSAGGHLASTAATHLEQLPDFQVLLYPVISMQEGLTHQGSRDNLLGKNPDQSTVDAYSNELCVTEKTPRAFIFLSADDGLVPANNSLLYAQALIKNGVPTTLHVYPTGGHGWGFSDGFYYKDQWRSELLRWLTSF